MKNYNDLTTEEKLACLSLYPEEAKKDEDLYIRLEAYRVLGFTEEAKKDEYWRVRLGAYRALGYTEEARNDQDPDIRQEAELYFKIKNDDMIEINGKHFSKSTIQEALKQYINQK